LFIIYLNDNFKIRKMNNETKFKTSAQTGEKNKKFKGNKKHNKKKFNPEFKKRTPTWKFVEAESKELLPKYDQVNFF
jgi:hypothetical protein